MGGSCNSFSPLGENILTSPSLVENLSALISSLIKKSSYSSSTLYKENLYSNVLFFTSQELPLPSTGGSYLIYLAAFTAFDLKNGHFFKTILPFLSLLIAHSELIALIFFGLPFLSILNWTPLINIEDGIMDYCNWYRELV